MIGLQQTERHYWLPAPDPETGAFERHAFQGRRWAGQPVEIAACGAEVAMAAPGEMDWRTAPTCMRCNDFLKNRRTAP
ncbi:hypothetical protein [Saccharopolyspora oryzae]|uniref:Zinc-finger n=1 Tax=Saccharopolyspora oryzae TaxID=2997343 RepID=A0ABT4UZY1_9PSEU|nr:hypothetical protein [Saccharopolyspora oryzae]MDA3627245.1 hypothetical protein [Saccharopolyspora oryzae]